MKTDPAQRKSNMFRCPIFWLVFFKSRQKPFVIRSSLQIHSLLLLLLSLSSGWCVKCALSFFALILKNIACKNFTFLGTVSLHMLKSLTPKMVVCLSPYCMIYNSSWAKDFFLSHIIPYFFLSHIIQYLHGRFFRRWNFHRKCQFPFIDLTKFPTIIDNVMFPYISLLCPTFTLWPRKSSIFPIFVIFVIYNPRFCPFVHFVIVQYCIYCPIYYLCYRPMYRPKGHPRRKYI